VVIPALQKVCIDFFLLLFVFELGADAGQTDIRTGKTRIARDINKDSSLKAKDRTKD